MKAKAISISSRFIKTNSITKRYVTRQLYAIILPERAFVFLLFCCQKSIDDTLKDGQFTSFFVSRIDFSSIHAVKDYTENQSGLLLKSLKGEQFKQLEKDLRMAKIVNMLTPVALF
ncbi:MAG: hypothetical protein IJU20_07235 [Clostridia bacterium]|nr:hypothetical protein [Clostridia bacterium]